MAALPEEELVAVDGGRILMDATMMVITMVVTTTMAIPVMRMMMDITMMVINALDRLPGDQPWDVVPRMFTVRQRCAASIRPPAPRTLGDA